MDTILHPMRTTQSIVRSGTLLMALGMLVFLLIVVGIGYLIYKSTTKAGFMTGGNMPTPVSIANQQRYGHKLRAAYY